MEKFNLELKKKLFAEEFEVHIEDISHRIRVLGSKVKEVSSRSPVSELESVRYLIKILHLILKDYT